MTKTKNVVKGLVKGKGKGKVRKVREVRKDMVKEEVVVVPTVMVHSAVSEEVEYDVDNDNDIVEEDEEVEEDSSDDDDDELNGDELAECSKLDLFSSIFSDKNHALQEQAKPELEQQHAQLHDVLKRVIITGNLPAAAADRDGDYFANQVDVNESMDNLEIKPKLLAGWASLNSKLVKKTGTTTFTPLQASLFTLIKDYRDVLYCNETQEMETDIQHLSALHAVNHIFKNRDMIMKNNATLKKEAMLNHELGEYRDQGFTRPQVLVIFPFKNSAYKFINDLITLSGCTQLANKKRFVDEFGPGDTKPNVRKPDDYNHTFSGNIDDCFKIGIKFSKKQGKLYSPFYSSDIIIASPLGLSMVIGAPGDKKREFDFLSSLEIVILDQSDIFQMQNWEHLRQIFAHLNLIPKASHGCDFSRVRHYALDGHSKKVRQLLCFSHFAFPDLNSLFSAHASSLRGQAKVTQEYSGAVSDVSIPVSQVFYRVPSCTLIESPATRFKFFVSKILPMLRHSSTTSSSLHQQSHTLILVPSFFDFTRIRNYMKEHIYSFAPISEYSSQSRVDKSRQGFVAGEFKFLLYTERYHFFRRTRLKGVKHVVFYGCPVYSRFYSEVVNLMLSSGQEEVSCLLLFDAFDRLALERIVGSERMRRMVQQSKEAYMFSI